MRRRREILTTVGSLGAVALAGCSDSGGSGTDVGENVVLVGPDNSFRFEPETLTVSTGTTVTWHFESAIHNVSCVPDHHDQNSLPAGAQPFASYEGDASSDTRDVGETFEHTFTVAGTYDYVCIPHALSGMTGTIEVQE